MRMQSKRGGKRVAGGGGGGVAGGEGLCRLHLTQERIDLEQQLAAVGNGNVDVEALEEEFIQVAGAYSERKGITYEAWRSAGVEPRVLKAAGIGRGQ
jgi:hypothetical protein